MAVPQRYGLPPVEALDPQVHHIAAEGNQAKPQIFVDPQAGKIPRRILPINVASTALGQTAIKTLQTVPDNAIWILHLARLRYLASATVGTRNVLQQILDREGNLRWFVSRTQPTAGQVFDLECGKAFTTATQVNRLAANGGRQDPIPGLLMPGWRIVIDDTTDTDNADTVSEEYTVEEFAVPRGLARDEVPMGLESGFLWDLTGERKVA